MITGQWSQTLMFARPACGLISLNDRTHWRARARQTKQWRSAAWAAALASRPLGSALPPAIITVRLPVPDRAHRDPHNYAPTMKAIIDGLVDAGWWPDDTPEHITTTEPVLNVQPEMRRRSGHIPAPGKVSVYVRPRNDEDRP